MVKVNDDIKEVISVKDVDVRNSFRNSVGWLGPSTTIPQPASCRRRFNSICKFIRLRVIRFRITHKKKNNRNFFKN